MLRQQLAKYTSALAAFTSSSETAFRVLQTLPINQQLPPPRTLYVLDSSFNPPTLAHLRIATSALLDDHHPTVTSPKRLLLLLATKNADKAPQAAPFEQRLLMMHIFAQELLLSLSSKGTADQNLDLGVDIAVTTEPYFADKSKVIEADPNYPNSLMQVHLTGFDTLIRILDSKYYPPSHTLHSLHHFLDHHRLRVTYRTNDKWGSREAQDVYLKEIEEGRRDNEGAKREWVTEERVQMCEGRMDGEPTISSTKVRNAARNRDESSLEKLVTRGIAEWILADGLYEKD